MHRFISVLAAALVAALIAAPAAAAANPGMISVSTPSIVKVDGAGVPEASAVVHAVYRSGYDSGALSIKVREAGTRVVLETWFPVWNQPCEPAPSYRCVTRMRIRDLPRVGGRALRRSQLYVVEAGFESFSGGTVPFNPFDPGIRLAAFWTV